MYFCGLIYMFVYFVLYVMPVFISSDQNTEISTYWNMKINCFNWISATVRSAVENTLLPVWFSRKGHDYMDFLDSINIDNNFEQSALKALETLAK